MRYIQKKAEPAFFGTWKQQFYNINGGQPRYDDLRGTDEYIQLKEALIQEQGYICCYCEKRIGVQPYFTDSDIEHFMPRHPDKRYLTVRECQICENVQLDYNNIMASCKGELQDSLDHCNHKKDNWFDFKTCISPTDERIGSIFGFSVDGRIFPINGNEAGQAMLAHLNLNSEILKRQRRNAYLTVLQQEFDEDELLGDIPYINSTIDEYRCMHEGKCYEFTSMITYCLEKFLLKEAL